MLLVDIVQSCSSCESCISIGNILRCMWLFTWASGPVALCHVNNAATYTSVCLTLFPVSYVTLSPSLCFRCCRQLFVSCRLPFPQGIQDRCPNLSPPHPSTMHAHTLNHTHSHVIQTHTNCRAWLRSNTHTWLCLLTYTRHTYEMISWSYTMPTH